MKDPTLAPAFVSLYPMMAEIARANGYALAVHGSVSRDFDLIAIPWIEDARDPCDMVQDIATAIKSKLPVARGSGPHGREVFHIIFKNGPYLEIGVMPRTIPTGDDDE